MSPEGIRSLLRDESGEGIVSALMLLAGVLIPLIYLVVVFSQIEQGRLAAGQAAQAAVRAAVEALSALVKNALDYTEDMSLDAAPYFEGRAVGCVATGTGWQGANATLSALRSVVHALRGWPTPLGIAFNTQEPLFNADGECVIPGAAESMRLMAVQLVDFASRRT